MVIEVHMSSHCCFCFSFAPLTCSHSSAILAPRVATSKALSRGLSKHLQLATSGRKFTFSWVGVREGALPSAEMWWSIASLCQCEVLESSFWLKQHVSTALPFGVVFCVFKKTCHCPQVLILTLRRRVELWNFYSRAYSPLRPGVQVRLQCASADTRTINDSKISSQNLENWVKPCCCEKSSCIFRLLHFC